MKHRPQMRYWHIAHNSWQPGQPLRCRDSLIADGHDLPWLWDEADEGTDTDRVCLFPDTEQGRQAAEWLLEDRPGYRIVQVDLPDDYDMIRAEWEDFPAVGGQIPAEYLTVVDRIT